MNAPEIQFRRATEADLAAICALLGESGLPCADLEAELLEGFLVAARGEGLVGVAGLQRAGEAALLRSVAVRAGLRGGGLGGTLVEACLARARATGIAALYLIPQDAVAQAFFERRGFALTERAQVPAELRGLAEFTHLCPSTHPCLFRPMQG